MTGQMAVLQDTFPFGKVAVTTDADLTDATPAGYVITQLKQQKRIPV